MKREKITFEFDENYSFDDQIPEGFKWIDEEITYFDSGKGFCNYDVIIQRKSDGKFFKGGIWEGQGRTEIENEWEEVFQQIVTKEIYV